MFKSSLLLAVVVVGCTEDEPVDPTDTGTPMVDTDTMVVDTDTGTPPDDNVYATLVRATLYTSDLVEAQGAHDALASYGEPAAVAAGDFAHDALTGTGLLGSTATDSFLGLDRWDDGDTMTAFYADPDFAAAFATLYAGAPIVESFVAQPDWHNWGSLEAGDGADPYFFAVVRGRLALSDPADAQAAHDGVAAYGEAAVTAVGDVAHVVFTGLDDPQEFMAIDVWVDDAAIEGVYTDPDFAAAFGSLFEAPPSLQIYQSTAWHQW